MKWWCHNAYLVVKLKLFSGQFQVELGVGRSHVYNAKAGSSPPPSSQEWTGRVLCILQRLGVPPSQGVNRQSSVYLTKTASAPREWTRQSSTYITKAGSGQIQDWHFFTVIMVCFIVSKNRFAINITLNGPFPCFPCIHVL